MEEVEEPVSCNLYPVMILKLWKYLYPVMILKKWKYLYPTMILKKWKYLYTAILLRKWKYTVKNAVELLGAFRPDVEKIQYN
jgi:hypothetical protein